MTTTWTGNTATVAAPTVVTFTARIDAAGLAGVVEREMLRYARRNPGRSAA